jgi:hypothetical protein
MQALSLLSCRGLLSLETGMEIRIETFGNVGSRENICPVPVEYKFKGKAKLVFGLPSLSLIVAFCLIYYGKSGSIPWECIRACVIRDQGYAMLF